MATITLGRFIINKRLKLNISSRQLALLCNITPAYLNDIEKNKRVPSFEVLSNISNNLKLNENDIYKLFDLAAYSSNGKVPYDIADYIMKNDNLRKCIRKAIKSDDNSVWDKLLKESIQEG